MNVCRVSAEVVRESPRVQPGCPVCGGVMVPQRDGARCSRCLFALCVGCEAETAPDQPNPVLFSGSGEA